MYRVTVKNGSSEYVLHHFASQDEQIYGDTLSEEIGKTPTFTFTISQVHPNIGQISTLSSRILIYDDDDLIFEGRPITPQADLYNTGTITCVGDLSYLADSMITPKVYDESISAFVSEVLTNHNGMVEAGKRFTIGTVNVAGRRVSFDAGSYMDALSLLNTGLEGIGGYLHVRHENGVRYLDYTYEYGDPNTQVVRFGENMLDISRQKDGSEIITCLIPEGAEVEVTNPDGSITKKRIDITSVASGNRYITNAAAVSAYGQIWGYATFDDITSPSQLLTAATNYLNAKAILPESIEVKALDLSLTDDEISRLKIGRMTQFVSDAHDISGYFLISKRETHITAPQNDTITFGASRASVSGAVSDNSHAVNIKLDAYQSQTRGWMEEAIENATNLITGGRGGYIVYGLNATDGHPEELFIMDNPNKSQAVNVIRLNRNGIGFSTTGINGPYANAWTIDGNLVADFITAGTMSADRVKGGTFAVGGLGASRDGTINIYNSLGQLVGQWNKDGINVLSGELRGSKFIVDGRTVDLLLQDVNIADDGTETEDIHGETMTMDEIVEVIELSRIQQAQLTGSIEIIDHDGNVIGRWDHHGITISDSGGNAFFKTFFNDRTGKWECHIGPFKIYISDESGANYLALDDETVGMGDHDDYAFWAGDDSATPPFRVDQAGGLWCSDMGRDWAGFTVGRAIKWIWDNWPGET